MLIFVAHLTLFEAVSMFYGKISNPTVLLLFNNN